MGIGREHESGQAGQSIQMLNMDIDELINIIQLFKRESEFKQSQKEYKKSLIESLKKELDYEDHAELFTAFEELLDAREDDQAENLASIFKEKWNKMQEELDRAVPGEEEQLEVGKEKSDSVHEFADDAPVDDTLVQKPVSQSELSKVAFIRAIRELRGSGSSGIENTVRASVILNYILSSAFTATQESVAIVEHDKSGRASGSRSSSSEDVELKNFITYLFIQVRSHKQHGISDQDLNTLIAAAVIDYNRGIRNDEIWSRVYDDYSEAYQAGKDAGSKEAKRDSRQKNKNAVSAISADLDSAYSQIDSLKSKAAAADKRVKELEQKAKEAENENRRQAEVLDFKERDMSTKGAKIQELEAELKRTQASLELARQAREVTLQSDQLTKVPVESQRDASVELTSLRRQLEESQVEAEALRLKVQEQAKAIRLHREPVPTSTALDEGSKMSLQLAIEKLSTELAELKVAARAGSIPTDKSLDTLLVLLGQVENGLRGKAENQDNIGNLQRLIASIKELQSKSKELKPDEIIKVTQEAAALIARVHQGVLKSPVPDLSADYATVFNWIHQAALEVQERQRAESQLVATVQAQPIPTETSLNTLLVFLGQVEGGLRGKAGSEESLRELQRLRTSIIQFQSKKEKLTPDEIVSVTRETAALIARVYNGALKITAPDSSADYATVFNWIHQAALQVQERQRAAPQPVVTREMEDLAECIDRVILPVLENKVRDAITDTIRVEKLKDFYKAHTLYLELTSGKVQANQLEKIKNDIVVFLKAYCVSVKNDLGKQDASILSTVNKIIDGLGSKPLSIQQLREATDKIHAVTSVLVAGKNRDHFTDKELDSILAAIQLEEASEHGWKVDTRKLQIQQGKLKEFTVPLMIEKQKGRFLWSSKQTVSLKFSKKSDGSIQVIPSSSKIDAGLLVGRVAKSIAAPGETRKMLDKNGSSKKPTPK